MPDRNLPNISIITANLNGGATLERTIASVIGQDYPHLEYVMVDGGSTDNSQELFYRFRHNIDVLVVEPDEGISDAFNKGIGLATGDLIGLISSDDYLEEGALQAVGNAYRQQGEPDVIYGDAGYLEGERRVVVRPDGLSRFWRFMPLKHPAVFIRRQAYERFGRYDLRYRYAMDYDLLLRFYRAGARFAYLDRPLTTISAGGLNQRFLRRTIGEVRDISIGHGTPKATAQVVYWIKMGKLAVRRILGRLRLTCLLDLYRRMSRRYHQ